jgi:pimeloyl-ACP methyl ester carboxylesterase
MESWPYVRFRPIVCLSICLLVINLASTGCSFLEAKKQVCLLDNIGSVKGTVIVTSPQKGQVVVLRFTDENGIPVLQRSIVIPQNNEYELPAIIGKHYVAAYIDVNGDGQYQAEEHGNYYGEPTPVEIMEKSEIMLDPITISGPVPTPFSELKPVDGRLAVWENIGELISMDDPRLTRKNYVMGLWKPFSFLKLAEGGLFFLEKYEGGKIPVILIHGALGGPTDWKPIIDSIDRKQFQPWVFYYPSGLRLDSISDYLLHAVTILEKRYSFEQFFIIGHSMGGLVTRSFVKKYVELAPANIDKLRLVMTVNSPMAGIPAAASGVKYSPIVVPSWCDIEPESQFLQKINAWNWPGEIPYHLVISYVPGESGDGVVPLQSQAQLKLQSEATRVYVFNNEHSGVIKDKAFRGLVNTILSNASVR